MKSFSQFLGEKIKYQYLFHGTSSLNRADIKKYGLMPGYNDSGKDTKEDGVYVTTDFHLAVREAKWTVEGENGEEGIGGSPVVVVIDRSKVSGLKIDRDYHPYDKARKSTSYHTEKSIPASAIIDIVRPTDLKYNVNSDTLNKQVGLLDDDGNPIRDKNGKTPPLTNDGKLAVYLRSNRMPDPNDIWSTNRDSESLDGKRLYCIIDTPNKFTIVDQMSNEVLLTPKGDAFRKWSRVPEFYKAS